MNEDDIGQSRGTYVLKAWEKLVEYWQLQNLFSRPNDPESEIRNFENKYKICLPSDLKEYFFYVGGMNVRWRTPQDREGYSFWPLEKVKSVPEEALNHTHSEYWSSFPGSESFFIFADYLDWSWAYAIRLYRSPLQENTVVMVGKDSLPIEMAKSFSEFVDLYLADSPRLYGVMR